VSASISGAGALVPWPSAGDCAHCGQAIHEETTAVLTHTGPGGHLHPGVAVLVHTGPGHERCEGRETSAERSES